jgi:hypothetical protein
VYLSWSEKSTALGVALEPLYRRIGPPLEL